MLPHGTKPAVCRWVGRQTLRWPRHKAIQFSWLGPERLVCCLAHRGSTGVFRLRLLRIFSKLFWSRWKLTESVSHLVTNYQKVQVGKDQEKAQSEKDSHSKNRGGKKPN